MPTPPNRVLDLFFEILLDGWKDCTGVHDRIVEKFPDHIELLRLLAKEHGDEILIEEIEAKGVKRAVIWRKKEYQKSSERREKVKESSEKWRKDANDNSEIIVRIAKQMKRKADDPVVLAMAKMMIRNKAMLREKGEEI